MLIVGGHYFFSIFRIKPVDNLFSRQLKLIKFDRENAFQRQERNKIGCASQISSHTPSSYLFVED